MSESLLQYGNRINIYKNVCQIIISQLNVTFDQLCQFHYYHHHNKQQYEVVSNDLLVNLNSSTIINDYSNTSNEIQIQNKMNSIRSIQSNLYTIQMNIQKLSGWYLLIYRLLTNIPAMLICFIYGLLLNRISQNYIMIIPCLGCILSCILFIINLLPNLKLITNSMLFILIGGTLYGLCGKSNAINLCVHSYITQYSNKKKCTNIIGRLLGVNFFGLAIGALLVGMFYRFLNYFEMIIFVIIGNLFIIIILLFLVKNSKKSLMNSSSSSSSPSTITHSVEIVINQSEEQHVEQRDLNDNLTATTTTTTTNNNNNNNNISHTNSYTHEEHKTYCQDIISYLLKPLFILKSSYKFLFPKRTTTTTTTDNNNNNNNKHIYLLTLLSTILLKQITKSGEQDVTLLYLMNQSNLLWNTELYAYYITCYYSLMFIQLIILLPIIENKFLIRDTTLIIIGLFTEMIRLLILSLLHHKILIFLSAIIGSPACYITTCTKSLISKLVIYNDELNISLTIISIIEIIANFIGGFLFIFIYNKTLLYYSSFIFIFDVILNIPVIIIFIWLRYKLIEYELNRN
ncbi:uncharacterized protein DC041_0004879 [Schistosoma bovis]|uniref:Uncharacterized protein n=1 Tax=Schistosoma bovis TaxID=6184 RepID=A0A430Q3V3_SCHBO|nr:uncharacterized protein DC041_0004879 [Schistosoma bovis]